MANIINTPDSWIEMNVSDIIQKISTNKIKVKQKEYLGSGSLPIIDQGSKYIGGYTNDFSKKIDCELPVIVFGDHTKVIKFINFDFAPGADGVKVIKPLGWYEAKLFQFFLKVLINKIPDKGYARHFQHIEKTQIPLPPLPEQQQIVAKIEELFSELDNGIKSLKKAREQLKTYRQAALKYAFDGKLTKEWRTRQKEMGNLPEPAEKLLERIKAEREKHYQKQIEDWGKACEQAKTEGKKKPARPKKPKELPPLTEKEQAELLELPDGWGHLRLYELADKITDGEHSTPKRADTGYYLLSARNIQNGYLSFAKVDYISKSEYLRIIKRCNPEDGDILISCSGTIGRVCAVPKNNKFTMVRSVALVKIQSKKYISKYLEYQLQSPYLQKQINKKKKATAQANLFIGPIGELSISLCSIPEQYAIVQEIETRLSVCDKLEQTIEDSLKKAEALRQSILKKAFEGELTRDWREKHTELITGENSAEKLLEKIKAEKALAAGREKVQSKKMKKQ